MAAERPVTLPEDAFQLTRGWLDAAQADELFEALASGLPWEQREITMFGRTHAMPRLVCWLGDASYTYSGVRHDPIDWTPELAAVRDRLGAEGVRVNSVLANLYRDGNDSMGWHRDDEPELGPEPVIASLNLGASRDFRLRERASGDTTTLELRHGDLLVMRGRSQRDWDHCVPVRRRVGEARINLTFRQVLD